MTERYEELEKRILKNPKNTLSFRIIRIFLIIVVSYIVYMVIANIVAEKLAVGEENMYYASLALEWTVPNVRGDFNFKEKEINAFGTTSLSYNLLRKVGSEDVVIGEANVKKRLFNGHSNITYSHPGLQRLNQFSFSLPEDPRTNEKLGANTSPHVWETLEMLPEGTVGELAFSTTSFMEPEQLIEKLQDYDIQILWMPLYAGEFVNYDPYSWSQAPNLIIVSNVIGLTGGMDHDDRYNQSLRIINLGDTSIMESKQLMLNNMEKLLQKSKSYYENFLGLGHLEEKYEYLVKEGFIVYGAVVTGPVKELLKLKDASFLQGEQLGEVELWNWEKNEGTDLKD